MKASELITLLQDAIDKYGDLCIDSYSSMPDETFSKFEVVPLDENGFETDQPSFSGKVVFFAVQPDWIYQDDPFE